MACVLPCQGPLCTSPFWVGSCLPHSLGTALAEPSRAAHLRSRVQATGAWVPTTWQAWLDTDLALGGRNTPVTPLALVSAQRGRFFKMGDRAGTAGVTGAVAHTALEVCQRCVTCPWCFIYSLREPTRRALFMVYGGPRGLRDRPVQGLRLAELGLQSWHSRTHRPGVPGRDRRCACSLLCRGRGHLAERRRGRPCAWGAGMCFSASPGAGR